MPDVSHIQSLLDQAADEYKTTFADFKGEGRIHQFESSLATAKMAVDWSADEADKEVPAS